MGKIIENYSLQELLGQGVYGKVFKGINLQTKEEVAVKVIKAQKFKDVPKLEECTVNEINTLSKIEDNQHIVRYIDMLKTVNNFYFVYEFCNGGTLQKLLQTYRNTPEKVMPEAKAVSYFKQMVEAFKVLSRHNIMHRDLKPDNILLHNGVIKIADFGFCKTLQGPEDLAQTMLGSPIYMAPEVLKGQIYTAKADIWSLGVVLYEMLTGECPYKSGSIAKLIQILDTSDASIPKTNNPNVQKLLKRMLIKDPNKRISWNQIFDTKLTNQDSMNQSKNSSSTYATVNRQLSSTSGGSRQGVNLRGTTKNVQAAYQQDSLSQDNGQMPRKSPQAVDLSQNNGSLRTTVGISSPQGYISKSPVPESNSFTSQAALDHFLSTHRKLSQIIRLSIEVIQKHNRFSGIISYILARSAEKQLSDLSSSLKKQIQKPTSNVMQQQRYREFKKSIDRQLEEVQVLMMAYKEELIRGPDGDKFQTLLSNRNRYIRSYVEGMRLEYENDQAQFVHASQVIDYFDDGILLKKDTYQRIVKQQLLRQINSKLAKL